MCKHAIETWEHYEYECDVLHGYIDRLSEVYEYYMSKTGKKIETVWKKPTREEWRLDVSEEEMIREKKMIIAKGRWCMERREAEQTTDKGNGGTQTG